MHLPFVFVCFCLSCLHSIPVANAHIDSNTLHSRGRTLPNRPTPAAASRSLADLFQEKPPLRFSPAPTLLTALIVGQFFSFCYKLL
ncbi:hypothetical protein M438DRAFT_110217 [Aureobasidium pullulans EXF-150]|uniref:Secreted protein n=1 Tax=Aureobasidium pullulans EXF-150 TaxID=1043002 RepID=A0A074XA46_AURPU|nr:uncharacterized protein M438DRAFT_110217 [Aureobasidium pullulans EXF-150]KEQ80599.1 hypothetical protein M438DRAFT_110217 [Aureobasidium pullulans EXF-150]